MFKVNNKDTRNDVSLFLIKLQVCRPATLLKRDRRRSGVFTVNFEHTSTPFSSVSIADFEQVNVCWGLLGSEKLLIQFLHFTEVKTTGEKCLIKYYISNITY